MSSVTVKEIVSKKFVAINEDEPLSKAVSIFKEQKPLAIIVLNSGGKYKGILTERWIVRTSLNPTETKVGRLTREAPKLSLDLSLSAAAKFMTENDFMQLPVFEGERLIGVITDEDIIHRGVTEKFGDTKVEEIMSKDPFVVEEDVSIGSVISLFRDQGFSRAPVVKKGKLVGIVTVHDIVEKVILPRVRESFGGVAGEKIRTLSGAVKGIMTSPVITVNPSTKLRDADKIMHQQSMSSLVIIRNGRLVGIMTKKDILEHIMHLEKVERGRLTVQFAVKGAEMDAIQQEFILKDFNSFAKKYENTLRGGTLFVYMKHLGREYKGWPLVHCRLQLRSGKGVFVSANEGWGVEQTFRLSLDHLERQILKSKEFGHEFVDPERFFETMEF